MHYRFSGSPSCEDKQGNASNTFISKYVCVDTHSMLYLLLYTCRFVQHLGDFYCCLKTKLFAIGYSKREHSVLLFTTTCCWFIHNIRWCI